MAETRKSFLLAIEGGGTRTRLLLGDMTGRVLMREAAGPASPLYIDRTMYEKEIREVLKRLRAAAKGLKGRVEALGCAGPMDLDTVKKAVEAVLGAVPASTFGESEIALALHGLSRGVSLVAGTGASCRAITSDGDCRSCGGFGPQFGDEGSGYWIGRMGISTALRAVDGRGGLTGLTPRMCDYFALERPSDIYRLVDRSGHITGTRVAGFAVQVYEAACDGDLPARQIFKLAGRELASLVIATTRLARFHMKPIPLVLSGGVFRASELLLRSFRSELAKSGFPFKVHGIAHEPTEGILRLMAQERG